MGQYNHQNLSLTDPVKTAETSLKESVAENEHVPETRAGNGNRHVAEESLICDNVSVFVNHSDNKNCGMSV